MEQLILREQFISGNLQPMKKRVILQYVPFLLLLKVAWFQIYTLNNLISRFFPLIRSEILMWGTSLEIILLVLVFFFLEREMLLLIFKSLYTGKAASLLVCNMNVANHTSVFVPLSQV